MVKINAVRRATWLLLLNDRAGVTVLSQELVDAGAIGHSRGRIRFLDRRSLEQSACGCYNAMAAASGAGVTMSGANGS
jgi:hypothetical protein